MIMGSKLVDVLKAKVLAETFLSTIGLELSQEKTRIGNTLVSLKKEEFDGKPGFEFLGFQFINRQVGIHRGTTTTRGKWTRIVQESRPSRGAVINHKQKLKTILRKYKSQPLEAMIGRLSASIRG